MRQNIPSIRMISEKEMISLEDVISISIKNIGADTVHYNWGSAANKNVQLYNGEEDGYSAEVGATFKGQKLFIDFEDADTDKRCILKMITRGKEVKAC